MKLQKVIEILDAKLLFGEDLLDESVKTACGSDMMSDVLAYVKEEGILISGLMNQQVIRTAEMLDMCAVVFVRGKVPTSEIIDLAKNRNIAVIATQYSMFEACGKLYQNGITGGVAKDDS